MATRPSGSWWPAASAPTHHAGRIITPGSASLGCLASRGRRLRLQHRQHLLGKELQAPLGHFVGYAAEAEGDVELEIADDFPALLEPAQDLVGRAPAGGLHEAGHRAFEPALARDLRLLLVGVVALHSLEVLTEKFIVVEIAFDELPLIAARFLLGLGEVGAADAELGQHDLWRLGTVVFAVQCAAALYVGEPHLPRPVGEHDDMGAELGGGIDRVLA